MTDPTSGRSDKRMVSDASDDPTHPIPLKGDIGWPDRCRMLWSVVAGMGGACCAGPSTMLGAGDTQRR